MHQLSSYKDLVVWQSAMALAARIYAVTQTERTTQPDPLLLQLRHNAAAVASSIAEGAGRSRRSEFISLLQTARSTLLELETHVFIASTQQLVSDSDQLLASIAELDRGLTALLNRLTDTVRRAHAQACAPEMFRT